MNLLRTAALSISLLSLLATSAGCTRAAAPPVMSATAPHPVVDYAVPVERPHTAEYAARFEGMPSLPTRLVPIGIATH